MPVASSAAYITAPTPAAASTTKSVNTRFEMTILGTSGSGWRIDVWLVGGPMMVLRRTEGVPRGLTGRTPAVYRGGPGRRATKGTTMGLLDKAKDAAKTVGDKAQEGIKAGQEKLDETKTKRKISDLKEELGGIVYAQKKSGATPNADAEITRIVGEIEELEASLTE
jgi:hypothetical protein